MSITDLLVDAVGVHLRHGTSPRIPAGGALIWKWFCALSEARTYHSAGPNPIGFSDIESYFRLRRLPIEPRHVDAIRAMDRAFLDDYFAHVDEAAGVARPPASALTPGLFDAVFGR